MLQPESFKGVGIFLKALSSRKLTLACSLPPEPVSLNLSKINVGIKCYISSSYLIEILGRLNKIMHESA